MMPPKDITKGLYIGRLGTLYRVKEVKDNVVSYSVEGLAVKKGFAMPLHEFAGIVSTRADED